MIQKIVDEKYHFISMFNPETGAYVRTGILNRLGWDTGVDPFQASFPHLIDVGVMGHCIHGKTGLCLKAGIGCYQSGLNVSEPNMHVADFQRIAEQCRGRVNQFAIGGRGDPDQHEHFEQILRICRENEIVPNYTTSGYGLTAAHAQVSQQYCGAVAVSWYRNDYTQRAIQMLLDAGVRTSIHYVLGNNSLDEAIARLEKEDFPRGIRGVVFLLHKPVGLGSHEEVLSVEDARVTQFFNLIDRGGYPFKVGLDSCSVPGAVHFCQNVIPEALDTCEGGRFSCYIGPDLVMKPCSFDQDSHFGVSLREHTIEEAWNSRAFERFRSVLRHACPNCKRWEACMGGCPLTPEIVLCSDRQTNPLKRESI